VHMEQIHDPQLVFGYGSIINDESRASTGSGKLPVARASLLPSAQFSRAWCFRSATGFTALGVVSCESPCYDMEGVLFVVFDDMCAFDRRERGYRRVQIAHADISLAKPTSGREAHSNEIKELLSRGVKIWMYVPLESVAATYDFPICQTYVDVVMLGCLEWGGEAMAEAFIQSTRGWSRFFLNDAPLSRRPWLHRKRYQQIDALLQRHASVTQYNERRHPEEFMQRSADDDRLRGLWGVPTRNPMFTGREHWLNVMSGSVHEAEGDAGGISRFDVIGLGGVGKTQTVCEFCHRYYGVYFGLILWLRAATPESLSADLRRFSREAFSMEGAADRSNAEVAAEVKARLYSTDVRWLVVLDNAEEAAIVSESLPRGAQHRGYVIVTSRRATPGVPAITLPCLDPVESVALLENCNRSPGVAPSAEMEALAEQLGHLPLALALAGALMRRCDVTAKEYLSRFQKRAALVLQRPGQGLLDDYPVSLASSLSLSLGRIRDESLAAGFVLDLLAYLAPDGISKALLQELVLAYVPLGVVSPHQHKSKSLMPRASFSFLATMAMLLFPWFLWKPRRVNVILFSIGASVTSCLLVGVAVGSHTKVEPVVEFKPCDAESPATDDLVDDVWHLLKSFSLISVREFAGRADEAMGSMHRLVSAVIRSTHSAAQATDACRICAQVLRRLWCFKFSDSTTWPVAGRLVQHIKVLASYDADGDSRLDEAIAGLLVDGAVVVSCVLSRFDEALAMLERALDIQRRIPVPGEVLRRTLHELGIVHRLQGNFALAISFLEEALGSDPKREADTMHELGVVHVRKHNAEAALEYLERALKLKHENGAEDVDVAATLHELAVAATNSRPPRLDEAERLLHQALALVKTAGATPATTATLHQLGRIAIRRGRYNQARTILDEALSLQEAVYGSRGLHVNVAAVQHQLGVVAKCEGRLVDSEHHFLESLRIRRHLSSCDSAADVAVSLEHLGRLALAQQQHETAEGYVSEQVDILRRLRSDKTEVRDRASKDLLGALFTLRSIYNLKGQVAKAAECTQEAKNIRCELQGDVKMLTNPKREMSPNKPSDELVHAAVSCRKVVRAQALAGARSQGAIDFDALRSCTANLLSAAAKHIAQNEADRVIEEAATSFCNEINCHLKNCHKDLSADVLLKACDSMRASLRKFGVCNTDERI